MQMVSGNMNKLTEECWFSLNLKKPASNRIKRTQQTLTSSILCTGLVLSGLACFVFFLALHDFKQ